MGLFGVQLTHFVGMREKIISLLLNNTDSFTTHFLYLHRDKYAAPNSTHKTRENPCLIYLSKIHFLFFFPLKILLPLLSFLSSPLFLPNEKTTHLGSNWKAKLIKSTTTTKVAALVVAPHSSSSSILHHHHHHHHLFFDLKLLSSPSPSPSPLGSTCLKTSLLSLSLPEFFLS